MAHYNIFYILSYPLELLIGVIRVQLEHMHIVYKIKSARCAKCHAEYGNGD